jgi:ubiquinone/menaquinone biosynthesis C-methylase UbiE
MDERSQQAWRQFWDGIGKSSDPLAAIDLPEISERTYRAVGYRIREILNLSPDDVVLNIGCGPGLFENQMAPEVKRIFSVDFSHVMVRKARHRNNKLPNAFFLQATGTALPFVSMQFEKVLCYSILHYFSEEELTSLLREIRRVTAMGTLVLLGDIEPPFEADAQGPFERALKMWRGAGVRDVIFKGSKRVGIEIGRWVKHVRRKWKIFAGQCVTEAKPQKTAQYLPNQVLSLAADVGFSGQVVEQRGERFFGGRYHILLRTH